jgi:ribosome maturation factor RimP
VSNGEAWLGKVEAVVAPVLASHGLSLVDTEWHREGRRWVLRFFVDKPGGVTVGDCQAVSREAGDVLDVAGLMELAYDLEMSSPGLDRELRTDREFAWAVGKDVRCWVREPVDGRTEFSGRLVAASPAGLTLAEPEGRTTELPRALVTKARLELAFGRSKLRRRKQTRK